MPIPKYDEMYRAFLNCLADGQLHRSKEVKDTVAGAFSISEKERAELLPSGKQQLFDNRIGWTRTYLKKAGLVQSPSRGVYMITPAGRQVLDENPPQIDNLYLLTTGIDVPEITTLVFMRRIKSRILFEQMLGRATRLCPAIGKTHFEIYDPVGVYESLQDVSNMKPVVTNPSASFEDLMKGLEVATTDEQLAYQIDLIVAKLQRKRRNVSQKALEQFVHLTGGKDLGTFAECLNSSTIKEATTELLRHRETFSALDKDRTHRKRPVVIDNHEDELINHTRGYGEGQKPEDYLEAFREFINNNMNAIAALRTVCTRPSELTREALKSLKLELDRYDFTEKQLNSASGVVQRPAPGRTAGTPVGGLECERAHPDGEQAGHPHGGGAGCDRAENEKLCPQGGAVAAGGRPAGAGTRTAPGQPHPVPVTSDRRLLESGRRVEN